LLAALCAVVAGDAVIAPSATRRLIETYVHGSAAATLPADPALKTLTQRENEVLRLLAQGLSNAEIAAGLTLSETTVKTHVARVLGKLGLRDRVQAVVLAYETGLIRPGTQPRAGPTLPHRP
jgi:DNA-binding NarL/FixJ family response regulator